MRRGKPLKRTEFSSRGTPLAPGQPLRRGKPLVSKTSLEAGKGRKRAQLVSKRPTVTAAERKARKLVRARSGGLCELCQRAAATNFQHRKAQAHGGEYSAVNGLDVCGMGNLSGCHGHIHQNPTVAYERGWSVRSGHDPATQPVWLAGRGWSLLRADGSVSPYNREAA